jgi:hypothetical protein
MSFAILGKTTKILTTITPFIALAGIVLLQSQEYKRSVQNLNHADYLAQEQEQAKSLDWQQQNAYLDFDNLQADRSYLEFVQYFGDTKARESIGYKLVPQYFETITSIDPRFTAAYLNLSLANSMYAGYPEKTIALMKEVLASVDPASEKAAYLWTSKGLDELLFMGDKEAAIKSYQMAAQWQALANTKKPSSLTIKDLELALQDTNEIELKQAQIRAWSTVLAYVRDQPRQREILDKIAHFQTELAALEKAKINQPQVIK